MGKEEIVQNATIRMQCRVIGAVKEMNDDVYVDVPNHVSRANLVQKVNANENFLANDCVKRLEAGG